MKKSLIIIMFLLIAGFVWAEPCDYSEEKIMEYNGINVAGTTVEKVLGKNAKAEVLITDTQDARYFAIVEGKISIVESVNKLNFKITTDSCTVSRIESGESDLKTEYDAKNIKVSGVSAGAKTKVFFGKIAYWFYNLFN
jgi:hypothetical protein